MKRSKVKVITQTSTVFVVIVTSHNEKKKKKKINYLLVQSLLFSFCSIEEPLYMLKQMLIFAFMFMIIILFS